VAPVIDRAEDGDGDDSAVRPARNRPADALPAETPATDNVPADAVPTDDVLTNAAQLKAAHLHYRDLVDNAYGKPREAWAEALPELRAAWEKHEEKYPERSRLTPRTQPDGAWEADGNRRLDPDQNAEASKICAEIRKEGKDVVFPAMKRVEAADPTRRLAGLQHMLKGEDRLKEKIADELRKPDVTVREALGMVPDAVRFTFTYSPQRYPDGINGDVARLKAEGFELVKLKNLWTDDQYKGINSQWRRPETGLLFEVQFHTSESLAAKELTHKAYERIRGSASPAERQELEAFQRRVNAVLATPPGTAEIKDFPEKR
jgi:hypothetical protein